MRCIAVYLLVLHLGHPPALADAVARYTYRESRCKPLASSATGWGLYQWVGMRRRHAVVFGGSSIESQTTYALAEWRHFWPRAAARAEHAGPAEALRLWQDHFGRGHADD